MAKTIKFNLICDDYPVRNIEQLGEHFSIEDMLKYYKNGLLVRWLNVRGYAKEEESVKALSTESDLETVKALIKIFDIESDENVIEENTIMLEYKDKERELAAKFAEQKMSKDSVIQEHFAEYQRIVDCIIEDKDNMAVCRAAIREIDKNYRDIFDMDYRRLFWLLKDKAPKAVFAMLMHDNMREKYLTLSDNQDVNNQDKYREIMSYYRGEKDRTSIPDTYADIIHKDKKDINNEIRNLTDSVKEILGDAVLQCTLKTAPYERVLEESGRYMILNMGQGDEVRPYDNLEFLGHGDIDGKFVILNGLAYRSDSNTSTLYYIEVEKPVQKEVEKK